MRSFPEENRIPKVSIIVLNWNGLKDTLACLESLTKINYGNYEIIVVDNASTDGSQQALRNVSDNIIFLENAENLGFSEGNNVGIRYALEKGTDYIFLVNNDAVLDPDTVKALVDVGERDGQIGMIGPKICDFYEPDKIWFAGAFIDEETGESPHLGIGEKDDGRYDKIIEVDRLTGCALMVKADVVRKIGLLDPDYFLYYEDVDWCVRAKKAGYKIVCVQYAKMWHKESASTLANQSSALHAYYDFRNKLLFLKKHSKNPVQTSYRLAKLLVKGVLRRLLFKRKDDGNRLHRLRGLIDFCLCRFGKRHTYHP